jgi:YidC/Oxa1 family membrane protein insertase
MENRQFLLLAVFFFSLYMLWQGWIEHQRPQQITPPSSASAVSRDLPSSALPASGGVPTGVASPQTSPRADSPDTRSSQTSARTVTVRTDVLEAEFSAQGGDLVHLQLLGHLDEDKKGPMVLFNPRLGYVAQSGLIGSTDTPLPNHKTLWSFEDGPRELAADAQALRLVMRAALPDGSTVVRTVTFHRGRYLMDVDYVLRNQGTRPLAASAYFQLVRSDDEPPMSMFNIATFTGPAFYTDAGKYEKMSFADVLKNNKKPKVTQADDGWVAMVQHYFVSAWLPQPGAPREFFASRLDAHHMSAGMIMPMAQIAPGNEGKLATRLYAGPQEQNQLKQIAPGFALVVDYGWLTVIAAPIFWVLEAIHRVIGNWGWSIIALTVLIKLLFFPLSAASYKSMAKMRVLTPKLMKLKETYGDDKQRLNTEMMALYKREKVNPLGGCLPILVQIPVFIALYWVLLGSVEMRQTPWLGWITDLSARDPYYVLPLIMGATMMLQTKLNPTPPDPIQAKVMMIMPVIFTAMFIAFPSGLVLYWTVNNVLSIAQQWQINRMIESGTKPSA